MNYEKEILEVLYEAGNNGLSVHKIAIHVHNAHNSLFSPMAFEDVRQDVQAWLLRNSRHKESPVRHCQKRGMYRINLMSPIIRQQILEFDKSLGTAISGNDKRDRQEPPASLFDAQDK